MNTPLLGINGPADSDGSTPNILRDSNDASGLELSQWIALLRRYRWWLLGTALLGLLAALAITLATPPVYRAASMIQIDREALKVVEFEGDKRPVEASGGSDFYQTQFELLKSRSLAERVANRLTLVQDPEFRKLYKLEASATSEAAIASERRLAADILQAGLSIQPIRNSRLVRIAFDSPSAVFSARIANAFAKDFIATSLEHKLGGSAYAKDYLEERLGQLKGRLEDSEKELVGFAEAEKIVTGAQGENLITQNLGELNTALAQAQAQRLRAEARWRQAQTSSGNVLPSDVTDNSVARPLQQRRAELVAQYQQQLATFKPDYPSMVQLRQHIAELDRQIGGQLGSARSSVRADYDAALSQERLLQAKVNDVRNQALDLQNRSIRYNILKREVDTNRQLYDALLQRYKEVGVASGVATNNVAVIDPALPPGNRFKPSLSRNLVLGLLSGLGFGLLLMLLHNRLDDRVRTPDQAEEILGTPSLGSVPFVRNSLTQEAERDLRSPFSESYRSICTALQFSTEHGAPSSLLITSSMPGEGKSTTALTLAHDFARLGKRVLLVEADMRNPSLHRTLSVSNEIGLSSYLAGARTFDEVMKPGDIEGLSLISSGPPPPTPVELLSGPRFGEMMVKAMEIFDMVIVDGPPVMGLADAALLAQQVERVVLVVAGDKTRRGPLQATGRRLQQVRARFAGLITTMYDPRRHGSYGYGYGDEGYYAYSGKSGDKRS